MSMETNARIIIDRLLHETGWDAEHILASVSSKEERILHLIQEMRV